MRNVTRLLSTKLLFWTILYTSERGGLGVGIRVMGPCARRSDTAMGPSQQAIKKHRPFYRLMYIFRF